MQTEQSASVPEVHTVDTALVPSPGIYEIDPVHTFPTMTYRSTLAAYDGDGTWDIDGQLTIRDITRAVRLRAWFRGTTMDRGGRKRVGFHAAARLRRQDFNLIADLAQEVGTLRVGTDVNIEVDAEATLRN